MRAKKDVPFEPHQINYWAWNDDSAVANTTHQPVAHAAVAPPPAVQPVASASPVVQAFSDLRPARAR